MDAVAAVDGCDDGDPDVHARIMASAFLTLTLMTCR